MTRSMTRFLCIVGFTLIATTTKAQFVTIPDPAFANWLATNGFAICMNGNQLDTTCALVTSTTVLNFTATYNISNLSGIVYFDNLETVYVFSNNLSSLPPLPESLIYLDCRYNDLTSLSNLPNGLRTLLVDVNQLTSIPANLPDSLRVLHCAQNLLTSLPLLPDSLEELWCHKNQITALPVLPAGMTELSCYLNLLTAMPVIPPSMYLLDCGRNQLTALPNLASITSLTFLSCDHNQISIIPPLPMSLYSLDCDSNLLTALPPMNVLGSLNCSDNLITSLPPISGNMQNLFCSNNLLTSIPPLPDGIDILWCNNNQLTSLPDLPESIVNLDISDNPAIVCLPPQNNLNSFKWGNTGIICLPNVLIVNTAVPLIDSVPVCDLFNANNCEIFWNISGKVFDDQDADCAVDNGENGFKNVKVKLYENGNLVQQTFTSNLGEYTFDTDTGTFYYTLDTAITAFSITCPATLGYTSLISPADSFEVDKNFSIECPATFDIGITGIIPYGVFRPGDTLGVRSIAGDLSHMVGLNCASGVSGSVRIILSGPVTYLGPYAGALSPVVNGDTLEYAIADFGSVDIENDFVFFISIFTFANIGDQFCMSAEVLPVTGDFNPVNNYYTFCSTIINSFDPNDKLVNPDGIIDTSQHTLNYTIRFQNTGNAPAQHIYIIDTLDAAIDESTIQLVAYSFEPLIQINGNVIRFNFQHINLPDSVNDEPNSHGFVQYNVRLNDSLALGTEIRNTAYIYFDFNAPIQTNTTYNQVNIVSGVEEAPATGAFFIYPNPVISGQSREITIVNTLSETGLLKIYDQQGRTKVAGLNIPASGRTTLYLPALSGGIYNCELTIGGIRYYSKLTVL